MGRPAYHKYFLGEYAFSIRGKEGDYYITPLDNGSAVPLLGYSESANLRVYAIAVDGQPTGLFDLKTRPRTLYNILDEWLIRFPSEQGAAVLYPEVEPSSGSFAMEGVPPGSATTKFRFSGDKYLTMRDGKFWVVEKNSFWAYIWNIRKIAVPPTFDKKSLPYVSFDKNPGLYGMSFSGADLTHAHFSRSKIIGIKFNGANLTNASFYQAEFTESPTSNLDGADFTETELRGAKFNYCDMNRANFNKSKFSAGTSFNGSKLQNATFTDVDLTGVDFTGADLTGATFTKVTLANTILTSCKLGGANLSDADLKTVVIKDNLRPSFYADPPAADRPRALLRKAKLNAKLIGLNWTLLDLTEAVIENLPRLELTGLKARYAIMPNIDLSNCIMTQADFTGAHIKGVNFTGATLNGADFSNQDLSVATFTGAKMREAILNGAGLRGVTLSGVDLTGAKMVAADCSNADLTACICESPATFSKDKNKRTVFRQAKLNYPLLGSDWQALDLIDATIKSIPKEVEKLNATNALLHRLDLSNRVLQEADFSGAELLGASLTNSDLTSAKFIGAFLQGDDHNLSCNMSLAFMKSADFEDANLTGVVFSYVYLYENAKVKNATMVNVKFPNAFLTGMDFAGVKQNGLRGADFTGACLVNAKFNGVEFTSYQGGACSLVRACLQGADFTDAKLFGANMSDAAVAKTTGTLAVKIRIQYHGELKDRKIDYDKTVINAEGATSGSTQCPTGLGPCTGDKLFSPNAPKNWQDTSKTPVKPPET